LGAPVVADVRISSGLDDVEQLPGGHVYLGSSDLELVDADEGAGQVVGLRFPGLGVPQGAVIVDAWVQFVVDEVSVGPVSLTVRAEAGSAGVFGSGSGDLSGRSLTAASVSWSPPDWGVVGASGVEQRTPDLSVLVQEVVDGGGWSESGALALVVSGSGQRIAEAFEGGAGVAPLFHIEYTTGGPVPNVAPVVDAGPDVGVVVGGLVDVGVSVSDDGLPVPPGVVVVGWEKVSGPGVVSFGDAGSVVTSVGFSVSGVYVLRLSADDGELVGSDDVTVTVSDVPVNQVPVVDAGPDVGVVVGGLVDVGVSVSDDGLPVPPGVVVVGWEKVSGPGVVSFGDAGSVVTSVGFSVSGVYVLRLSADDGELVGSDDVTVTVTDGTTGTLRFAAIGDYGDGQSGAAQVADLIADQVVDIVVTTGDNTYGNTNFDDHVGQFYSQYIGDYVGVYGPGAPVNRFFPALGDSTYDFNGLNDYTDYFTLPGAGIPTSGTAPSERYYDFVQGAVHFFVLNSNPQEPDGITSTSTQAQWLEQALAASTSQWQVVTLHHPPFSSGVYPDYPDIDWPFAAWGADAVLFGHEHVYERLTHDGIPYIITGLGGGGIYSMQTPHPESELFYNDDYGALIGTTCDAAIVFELHSITDGLIDTHTIGSGSCS
jgi:hypothetical protein